MIGGSGPTGVLLIDGLLERGHRVWMLHSGAHKPDRAWYDDGRVGKIITNAFKESDLVEAESQRIGALQTYRSAEVGLERAQGTILDAHSVELETSAAIDD